MFCKYKWLLIKKANDFKHKYVAEFLNDRRIKHAWFGAYGMSDSTIHKVKERRERYIKWDRGMGEDWNNPMIAGSLATWILWGPYTSITKNITYLRNKF